MNSNTRNGFLKNKIEYIYQHNEHSKTTAIMITIRYGGAFYLKENKSGLAHLIEHLVFKGTIKRPYTKDLMYELDSLGGIHNAYTSKTTTAYHIKIPNQYLENGLDLLSDMVKNPKFLSLSQDELNDNQNEFMEEFIQEKKIVQKELLSIKDNFSRYIHELIEKNILEYPLNLNFEDDLNDLEEISIQDVIDAFKKFYVAENICVSIYGNLDLFSFENSKNIEKLLEKYLGDIPSGTKNLITFTKHKNAKLLKKIDIHKIRDLQNANITIAWQNYGYKDKKLYYMTELFSIAMTDITSSRLFQKIREEKGLVYRIHSSNFCYDELGYYSINTNTQPKNLELVVSLICEEVEKILNNGLNEKEFELAKKNYLGKLVLESENSMTIAEYNVYEIFYNKNNFISYSQIPEIINNITLNEMNVFLKDLLNKPSVLTILKPN